MRRDEQEHRPLALFGERGIGGDLLTRRTELLNVRDREAGGDQVLSVVPSVR